MLPVDTSWFDENPQKYLQRPEFIRFQEVADVDFMDLKSDDTETLCRVQEKICAQSITINETRKEHAGFGMPFIAYTHDLNFGSLPSDCEHQKELDILIAEGNLFDSLRRRHIALSHCIIPHQLDELTKKFRCPLKIANLGSGVGLDLLNALQKSNGYRHHVDNYDVNQTALELGEQLTLHLKEGPLEQHVVRYHNKSLTKFSGPIHLAVMVGIICGVDDQLAHILLKKVFNQLESGGHLIVTSSNERMRCESPLNSFIIQHIGTPENPHQSWGLNFRSRETMKRLLTNSGFKVLGIYDDWNYPGIEKLDDEILYGVDTLPSKVMGNPHTGEPLTLPPEDIRRLRHGYNWIAIACKNI